MKSNGSTNGLVISFDHYCRDFHPCNVLLHKVRDACTTDIFRNNTNRPVASHFLTECDDQHALCMCFISMLMVCGRI